VLFVFAHQDDEYAALPWIFQERAGGAQIACLYLTDGAGRASAETRDAESRDVLRSLGIADDAIVMLSGGAKRIADLNLAAESLDALAAVDAWIEQTPFLPRRIYAPSYEGGHPDHDAAHLIAAVIAAERGLAGDAWHFSLYNAYRCPRPFFATMRQLPAPAPRRRAALSPAQRWNFAWLCWRYRSQWRTWLGLFPGAFYARAIAANETVVRFDFKRLTHRPHSGELLYERLFATSYECFEKQTRALRERLPVS